MEKPTSEKLKIKFRNYKPYDQSLLKSNNESISVNVEDSAVTTTANQKESSLSNAVVNSHNDNDNTKHVSALDKILAATPANIIQQELEEMNQKLGTNELNIVPKKINWDLKRHSEFKIEKLRKRTQRAIVEILREKIAENGDGEDADTDDNDDIDV